MNLLKTGMLLATLTALFMGVGYLIGGSGGAFIAFLVAAGMNLFSYWNADSLVLRLHRAREVDRSLRAGALRHRRRAGAPRRAADAEGLPDRQPAAERLRHRPQPAERRRRRHDGILNQLTREELAGVIGHELTHVKNRDTLTMTIAATIAGAISMLANFAFFFGGSRNNNNPLGFVGVLLAAITAPLAAMLIQMAISRTREYSADRGGAELCGNPLWLASALAKIERAAGRAPMITAEQNPATAPLFIINPLSGERMDNLFSTHPATENRIAALEEMARSSGLGATAPAGAPRRDAAAGRRRPEPLVARGSRHPARPLGLKARPRPAKARGAAGAAKKPRRRASRSGSPRHRSSAR